MIPQIRAGYTLSRFPSHFHIFFVNTETDRINIKIWAGRDASLVTSQRHPTIQVYCYYCFVYSQSQEYKIHLIKRLEVLVGIYHEVSCS